MYETGEDQRVCWGVAVSGRGDGHPCSLGPDRADIPVWKRNREALLKQ